MGFRVQAQWWHVGLALCDMWNCPRPRIKPVSSVLAGKFLTMGLPGKSNPVLLIVRECLTGEFLRAASHESFVPLQAEQHAAPRD